MEPTDSTETVAEDLDMNLDSFKISPLSASNTRPSDVDSETQSAEYRRQQQLSTKHSPKEQGVDEQEYDREHQQQEQPPQERGQPEPRLESLSRLALALAQEEEDAKQGSNHDRYVDQRDGDNGRLGDPSEYNDSYQQSQHRQRGSPSPAAHIHSYSDRETATGTHDERQLLGRSVNSGNLEMG
ncbi:hypothetical protein BGZ73_000850 [Actinomortierella ambigua]|nr:hypothetical protein BGZ73_000850 [Actinomortierella ambigua]